MKNLILIFTLQFFAQIVFAQGRLDSLVTAGVKYHDSGDYASAIASYKKALEIDPNSSLANYEIAMSYMYAKEYTLSMEHCDKVIQLDGKNALLGYVAKGSCLDYLGKTEESIKLYEKAIKAVGPDYLLYYNLALDYYKLKDHDAAQKALVNAIKMKSDHASSHLLLGYVMAESNQRVQSLLCFHYFLFLEPGSERAKSAYSALLEQFGGNIEKNADKPGDVTIFFDPKRSKEFGPADMMVSMLAASDNLDKNKNKSADELFISNTTSFFEVLGDLNKKKNKGLWWEFYTPFFYRLSKSEHMAAYCYYISKSTNPNAQVWLSANSDKLDKFDAWLKQH